MNNIVKSCTFLILIIATLSVSGCKLFPVRERIVIQYVNVPIPIPCPIPNIPARTPLPSTTLDNSEPFSSLKGCIMNQENLLLRVNELETLLRVYQDQPKSTEEK